MLCCFMNLTIGIWETNIFFAEINEEIEEVMEDLIEVESLTQAASPVIVGSSHIVKSLKSSAQINSAHLYDFFEVDSPPPEVIA